MLVFYAGQYVCRLSNACDEICKEVMHHGMPTRDLTISGLTYWAHAGLTDLIPSTKTP
eukprot:c21257_g1_i4 orf=353-526(+)